MSKEETIVYVRWLDGYMERFECSEDVRVSKDFISLPLTIKQNRKIPLANVRWYSITPESHERN